jgi:uncharacterized protein YgbK (DUF1537 family)
MALVLALADDLTGALEAGAKFAGRGIPSVVSAGRNPGTSHPVVVIDTETRHLPPEQAAAAVAACVPNDAGVIYKKTDSTLRGNISAELRALARACPGSHIAYVPAYPALGRTVKQGELHVYGVPVHQTSYGRDPLNPIAGSSIARLLGDNLPCTIYDGETEAEVAQSVAIALADPSCRIIAGPASVAAAIAEQLDIGRQPVDPWPAITRCLIVNGSLHEVSAHQISWAERNGCASPSPSGAWRIMNCPPVAGGDPLEIAAQTGGLVVSSLTASDAQAVMVFGGDTAFGILEALGCPLLEPLGEVVMGVPVSRVVGRNLYLITKAGGFGDEPLICRVRHILDATDQ